MAKKSITVLLLLNVVFGVALAQESGYEPRLLVSPALLGPIISLDGADAMSPVVAERVAPVVPLQSSSDQILRRARTQRVLGILHNTFGFTALGFVASSAILNPDLVPGVPTALHASFGYTASGFAIGALATGFLVHSTALTPATAEKKVDFLHAVLGIAGGLIVAVTPYLAPGELHEVMGIAGASTMGLSVLLQLIGG
jgi:hypothetical protein